GADGRLGPAQRAAGARAEDPGDLLHGVPGVPIRHRRSGCGRVHEQSRGPGRPLRPDSTGCPALTRAPGERNLDRYHQIQNRKSVKLAPEARANAPTTPTARHKRTTLVDHVIEFTPWFFPKEPDPG